jgi:hypothetical protein
LVENGCKIQQNSLENEDYPLCNKRNNLRGFSEAFVKKYSCPFELKCYCSVNRKICKGGKIIFAAQEINFQHE